MQSPFNPSLGFSILPSTKSQRKPPVGVFIVRLVLRFNHDFMK